MSIFTRKKEKRSKQGICFLTGDNYDSLCCNGYVRLSDNPEVVSGCRRIADAISTMTIHLMANSEKGDKRIINELSRKIDISPNRYMTRKTFIDSIVMNLLLYGRGNSVVYPRTINGYLDDLIVVPSNQVSFVPDDNGYKIKINGIDYDPDNLLHFVYNPDERYPWKGQGITAPLKDVADNLKQAATTKNNFMSSKWKPSVIVKVDALTDEFSSPEGRRKLLNDYLQTEAGEPWMIPAEQFDVKEIRPLSLADLAINEANEIDKRTVAALLGVPPFVVGVGEYNASEWNAFINNTVRPIAISMQQEMTKKLIVSPKMYWRFNMTSLYAYDLKTIADVYGDLYKSGLVLGNEVRDKIGLTPMEGLDKLVILENYIPLDKISDQQKLN